jgi:hypothetical protein
MKQLGCLRLQPRGYVKGLVKVDEQVHIPARWETGWTTGPDQNMHDWWEIYLAPYGWVPADVWYESLDSEQEREKWFYLGGIDCYRLVVNTDHNQPRYPAKSFFRSELVDFQRGAFSLLRAL